MLYACPVDLVDQLRESWATAEEFVPNIGWAFKEDFGEKGGGMGGGEGSGRWIGNIGGEEWVELEFVHEPEIVL